ncbi:MAG: hypothetical protein ACJAVM_000041 [Sulfitobacter sp.]|jgi:hypothetical protein
MKNIMTAALIGTIGLAGCAQKAEDVTASYISPMAYQSYSCKQIAQEATRVSGRVGELSGVQNKKASDDAVATGIALVIFWPAAFFIKGDKQTAAELGRLKGELEALEQTSIRKNCGIVFQHAAPADAEKEDKKDAAA